jgi:hypothetical protein
MSAASDLSAQLSDLRLNATVDEKFAAAFDIMEMPCVLFRGDDRCACSAAVRRWVTARGGSASARVLGAEEKAVAGPTWRKFPHRANHCYIEADMYSGNAGEKAAFVEQVTSSFSMQHVSQRKHVLVLHNIDYLPQRTLVSVCDAVLPNGVIIATASNGACLPDKLLSRAVILRVASPLAISLDATELADVLMKSKGAPEDCRAFAHKGMKLCCPTTSCFRALLAHVNPPDPELIGMAADLEHRARIVTICSHALELFAMEVYDHVKRVKGKKKPRLACKASPL